MATGDVADQIGALPQRIKRRQIAFTGHAEDSLAAVLQQSADEYLTAVSQDRLAFLGDRRGVSQASQSNKISLRMNLISVGGASRQSLRRLVLSDSSQALKCLTRARPAERLGAMK